MNEVPLDPVTDVEGSTRTYMELLIQALLVEGVWTEDELSRFYLDQLSDLADSMWPHWTTYFREAGVDEDRADDAARELWHEVTREMKEEWAAYRAARQLAEEHVARVYTHRRKPPEEEAELMRMLDP